VLSEVVEILDLARREQARCVGWQIRSPTAALIVVDHDVAIAEHLGHVVVDRAEIEAGVRRESR